jgi:hypothetical protein
MTKRAENLVALLLLALVLGCGKSGPGTVPVRGKVTFAGGLPPTNGTITFTPIKVQEGMPKRPGTAQFDKNGDFQAQSFKPGDGLFPGTYRPNVSCWMGNPDSNDPSSFDRLNYVPKDFQPPDVVVDAKSGATEVTIDIPKKE